MGRSRGPGHARGRCRSAVGQRSISCRSDVDPLAITVSVHRCGTVARCTLITITLRGWIVAHMAMLSARMIAQPPDGCLSDPDGHGCEVGRVVVVSAGIGAGHDGIARELAVRLGERGFDIEMVDFLELLPGALGSAARSTYAWQLSKAPMTWDVMYSALERHRLLNRAAIQVAQLARSRMAGLVDDRTVAVVSTYPMASQVLGSLRRRGLLKVPVATFLCDMSVHPLWVAEGVDAHLAMHKIPADQARGSGATGVTIAMPAVASRFVPARSAEDRATARARFGLPPERPVALVLAGSWGVGQVVQTAVEVGGSGVCDPVVVCGHNSTLRRQIDDVARVVGLGWVQDMPGLLSAADVVVHNAGGLSCMEALAAGVPVVGYRPLSGHGRTNLAALADSGIVVLADSVARLHEVLADAVHGRLGSATAGPIGELWDAPDPASVIAALATGGHGGVLGSARSVPGSRPR